MEALKKPGETPSLFAYLNLPVGRPPRLLLLQLQLKLNLVPLLRFHLPTSFCLKKNHAVLMDLTLLLRGEFKAAKAVVLQHLTQSGDLAAAIKASQQSHPIIVVKRQDLYAKLMWIRALIMCLA